MHGIRICLNVLLHALISLLLVELSHLLLLSRASYKRNTCSCKRVDASCAYYMGTTQKIWREQRNDLDTEKKRATVFLIGILCCYLSMQDLHDHLWTYRLSLTEQYRRERLGYQQRLFRLDA